MLSAMRALRTETGPAAGFIAAFGLWSGLNGLSLLVTQDAFDKTPVYAVMAKLNLPENLVGALMVADGLALFWSIGRRAPVTSAFIAYGSGISWVAWSVCMFLGGLRVGLVSSSAIWTTVCALALMRTISGYARREVIARAEG